MTDETDYFPFADKPSGGELITGLERYGDLSPTIGFVLRLHVRESIQYWRAHYLHTMGFESLRVHDLGVGFTGFLEKAFDLRRRREYK